MQKFSIKYWQTKFNNSTIKNPFPNSTTYQKVQARCQWLTPIILATQEADIRRITVRSQPFTRSYLEKAYHKKGLAEWLKV
jgi:hypothetical protein